MKRVFNIFFLILIIFLLSMNKSFAAQTNQGNGADLQQALSSSKPMVILLYAPWSDSTAIATKNMNSLKRIYGKKANFVLLDIASKEAKIYNSYFSIQPNLPYVQMFKHKAKIKNRVLTSCLVDYACVSNKVGSFID